MTTPDNYEAYTKALLLDDPEPEGSIPVSQDSVRIPFALLVILVATASLGVGLAFGMAVFG